MTSKMMRRAHDTHIKGDIVRNAAYCNVCQTEIESKHRHDFRTCRCGALHVDGGLDYLKRTGRIDEYEERSEFVQSEGSA